MVCLGRRAEDDLIALVQRRILEGETARRLPIVAPASFAATPGDLGALVAGRADLERTLWLARALSALRWPIAVDLGIAAALGRNEASGELDLDPAYLALRLTHLGFPLSRGSGDLAIPADPSAIRLLAGGEPARAFQLVLRRLRAAGLQAPLREACLDAARSRRWAASLAFPISRRVATRFARLLDPATFEEELSHAH
jgi:CRISPR-associated protein Csx17